MEFFTRTGKMAIGSRLRLLTAHLGDEAARIHEAYQIEFSPKWFPVFFLLAEDGEGAITEMAKTIGHSAASVSKLVNEMKKAGLVEGLPGQADKRRNVVTLTAKGKDLTEKLRLQWADVDAAVQGIMAEASHDLWAAIEEWEHLLESKSLLRRVQEERKRRESQHVRIVDYEPRYRTVFRDLNVEWISTWFKMEEADYKALDHPDEYIIARGGRIFVALYHDEPVGVCALIRMDDPAYGFELAKMAVSPRAKGKNIGWLLGCAAVDAATRAGASKLYLESNTILKPAIRLYEKLGFRKIVGRPSPYSRANIQMELDLTR